MTKVLAFLFLQISDTGLQQQENICLTLQTSSNICGFVDFKRLTWKSDFRLRNKSVQHHESLKAALFVYPIPHNSNRSPSLW